MTTTLFSEVTTNSKPKYTNPYSVYDAFKTYMNPDSNYTKNDLLPSVAYMEDGKIQDTMFDSFIILPSPVYLYDYNRMEEGCHKPMTKREWQVYIDEVQYAKEYNMDELDAAVGETKKALGRDDYQANVFLSLFYPTKGIGDAFGEVYGKALDLTNDEDRAAAVQWMAQCCKR